MAVISIGNNISALRTASSIGSHTKALSKAYQHLSSGKRIVTASDDAAGLAISMNLNKEVSVYGRATKNISDGMSAASIIESALTQLVDITIRRKELAEQAANGVYTDAQRVALDNEFYALDQEYDRIINTTSFNGMNMLNGETDKLIIQVAYSQIELDLGGISSTVGSSAISGSQMIGYGRMKQYSASQAGGVTVQVATGDINKDGTPDIIASDYGSEAQCGTAAGYSNGVYTLISTGDGGTTGSSKTEVGTASRPYYVELADVNGDGNLDMLTATQHTDKVYVALGDGSGSFGAANQVGGLDVLIGMTTGDVNGDGVTDVIMTGKKAGDSNYYTYTMTGRGNGTFNSATKGAAVGTGPFSIESGNLNNSGGDEVVVGTRNGSSGTVKVLSGSTLSSSSTIYSGSAVYDVTIGDLNDDGYDDIAIAAGNKVIIFQNNNGSSYTQVGSYDLGSRVASLDIGDIDGDGKMDIAAVTRDDNRIHTIMNTGEAGTGSFDFEIGSFYRTGKGPNDIKLADVNGDGMADAIVANSGDGSVGIMLAQPDSLNILTQDDALRSLGRLDSTLNDIYAALGIVGAFESRLQSANNVTEIAKENYAKANSAIVDIDVASESSELVRNNILQKLGTAILAQSNIQPEIALKLLSDD